ncbi:fatty acid synthase [Biomphalaria glabrata]|nr:fatty acid synthase [Biomphalaria glabrata]
MFPGAGCNWTNMHQGMMRLPLFKETVDRASKYAKEKHGIEIFPANPGDLTLSLLQIAVIQIALVDILKAVGIEGDYFFGHSNGEVACGYATGCLTLEQAVSLAYARSLVSVEGRKILKRGKMAAVGLSWEECTKRCPPGVIPACHNASDSVTISGEADRVTKFVEQLVSEGIFAREVDSQGTAYHTPEISQLDAFQEEILSPIIPNAKKRPANWWSTSFPESEWGRPEARDCSVQYYTHNSKNPVYFHEAVLKIPKGALVVEIGPHGLLMPVVKRTCGESIIPVTLMRRNEANNVSFCLSALGKCYLHGIDINPLALHSPVQFPVPLSTPIISPALAKIWDHSAKWRVPHYTQYLKSEDATNFLIHLESGAEFEYLTDHRFNDEPMLPASACLVMAWKAYAKKVGKTFDSLSVQLSDVTFSQQPIVLAKGAPTTFKVQVSKQSGQFEVSQEGEGLLCQGVIKSRLERHADVVSDSVDTRAEPLNVGTAAMNKSDFYTFWRTQGYEHTGRFEGVVEASLDFSQFSLEWNGNWILFLDYIMQTTMSKKSQGKRCLPYKLKSLEIDAVSLPVVTSSPINLKTTVQGELTECTGVRLSELKVYELTQTSPVNSSMDITTFIPYTETPEGMFDESLRSYSEDCLGYILHQLKNVSHTLLSRWFSRKVVEELSNAKSHKTSASLDHYLHSEDCVLAPYLKNVFTCCRDKNETKMAEIFTELETTLFKDRLFSSMNADQILKPCLDIIMDNLNVYSMSIFEIDGRRTRVFPRIINLLKHEPKCAFSYSIGAARVIHDKEAAELGVQEVIWDFGSNNSVVKTNSCHLVIARNALHKQKDPKEALLQAKDLVFQEGFLLVEEITDAFPLGYMIDGFKSKFEDAQVTGRHLGVFLDDKQWQDLFKSCNLELIYKKANNIMSTIYLLRKMTPNIQRPILITMEHTSMTWLNQLKSALQEIEQSAEGTKIWLVASDQSGVSGFMKSLKSEGYGRHVRYILVSNVRSGSPVPELTKDCEAMTNLIKKDLHSNVYRDGQWGTFSLLPYTPKHYRIQTNHAFLHKPANGTPQTIDWVDSSLLKDTHESPLTTYCIGLENEEFEQNVKDGSKIQDVDVMGFDVSGRLEDGRRVMACVTSAAQTQLDISKGISLHIPDHWSFEEAATVPMSYSRAYYSLGLVTDLVKGDNVLVADAGHPIGQAVLTLTLASGYSTFALVDDSKEKSYVCNLFPQLDPQRVVCVKDPDHVQRLIAVTENRGLAVIFNAYTDRTPSDVVELLAQGGHFVQVRPTSLKSRLIRCASEKMASVSIVDLHRVLNSADEKSLQIKKGIADRITEGISKGIVKPLDHIVYKTDEVETVMRDVANKFHNKKIIIKVQDGRPEALLTKPKLPQVSARKRALCHPKRSYVIIGGLGGFGLELAHWLVKRGCRYVVLSSRRGVTTGYQQYKVNLLRSLGVTVLTSTETSVSFKSASALLAQASNLAPLGGIFNASMVNSDEMFDKMTNELFQAACEPKVNATSHFDQLTRELCKDNSLWFVTFSSQTSARGNPAQTNYAYANSFMERVCEKRAADGLHGLAIQWGWIGSVGTVVKRLEQGDFSTQYISQYLPQGLDSCFDCMEQALVCGHPVVGVFVKNTLQTSHVIKDNDTVKQSILDQVVKILALKDPDSLTDSITLQDVGIDSIMTSEVKQLLEKSVNVSLSNKEVKTLTFQKLREMDASR